MPITEGHYNVILRGKFAETEDVINSFYFEVAFNGGTLEGDDAELFSVGKRFWDNVKADLRAVTTTEVEYKVLDVFKADGADVGASGFYTIPIAEQPGLRDEETLPPEATWTFQYTRPNANFRHGYKRFAGVSENLQSRGIASAAALVLLNTLATTLGEEFPLEDGILLTPTARPVLVQRQLNGLPVDPDVWYYPSSVIYKKIGSQDTRAYGRGS